MKENDITASDWPALTAVIIGIISAIAVLLKLDATPWYPTELGSMPAAGLLTFIYFIVIACIVGAIVSLILAGVQKASSFVAARIRNRKSNHQ